LGEIIYGKLQKASDFTHAESKPITPKNVLHHSQCFRSSR